MAALEIAKDHLDAMLVDYNLANIKAQLQTYPRMIRVAKTKVNNARQDADRAANDRQLEEANLMVDVAADTDEKGKPRFSNMEIRAAELARRKADLDDGEDYRVAAETAEQADMAYREAVAELERLVDEYKSYCYLARITVAELSLLAAIGDISNGNEDEKEVF